jgi:hypothetical protein
MHWYIAKMIFRIICGDGDHRAQFDEQLRIVLAGSREEALHKAQLLGMHEEESFFNRQQQLVQWQFINTSEIYRLEELVDGTEIYSRIEEPENADIYLLNLRNRSEHLLYNVPDEIPDLA